jgi:hypothetical protein
VSADPEELHSLGSILAASVAVVERRVSEEVAEGQAARGGRFAGSASIGGGASSAICST